MDWLIWTGIGLVAVLCGFVGWCLTQINDLYDRPPKVCPDHGPLRGGRCHECEHIDLLVDTGLEYRHFGSDT